MGSSIAGITNYKKNYEKPPTPPPPWNQVSAPAVLWHLEENFDADQFRGKEFWVVYCEFFVVCGL